MNCKIFTTFNDLVSGKRLVFLPERSLLTLHTTSDKSSDFKASWYTLPYGWELRFRPGNSDFSDVQTKEGLGVQDM